MKLGACYMVFDGSELLEFAIKSIRKQIDFISVTYQTISYFGNQCDPDLINNVQKLKNSGEIDELIHFQPDLSKHHKINELNLRNLGLQLSKNQGCTHHISFDVDEFCIPEQLEYIKKEMKGDYNYSIVKMDMYYKNPQYLIYPDQKLQSLLMHPVNNEYSINEEFPFPLEITKRLIDGTKPRIFTKEEFTLHHMSYVRKDIRRKLKNSDNGRFYKKIDDFFDKFDKYKLGDRLCIVPDFMNRKTKLVENTFNINWEGI